MPTWAHGKDTAITIGTVDVTEFCNTSEFGRKGEAHNVTVYGTEKYADGRMPNEYHPGNVDATFKCGGVYDTTAGTGTAELAGMEGTKVVLKRSPLGIGTGKPQQTVDLVVTDYTETSPVADMVTWQLEGQCSGLIVESTQA